MKRPLIMEEGNSTGTMMTSLSASNLVGGDRQLQHENEVLHTEPRPHTKKKKQRLAQEPTYPVAPVTIQIIHNKPRSVVNHSYRDFSRVPSSINDDTSVLPEFGIRLHALLSNPHFANSIYWQPHGRAFRIGTPNYLEQQQVFLNYFGCKNYAVFVARLQSWGFRHLTSSPNRNCWYHELFLRGLPHLLQYMVGPPTNARRRLPDPENEPDFDAISQKYPLPE